MPPFANWQALIEHVKTKWKLEAVDDHGEWFERLWEWTDPVRSQLVTIARVEHGGEVWVSWTGAIAEENEMTDAQIIEATAAEVGRIIRDEGCCWLEQHVPLAQLTPALFERLSDAFAERADNLEQEVTGADQE